MEGAVMTSHRKLLNELIDYQFVNHSDPNRNRGGGEEVR